MLWIMEPVSINLEYKYDHGTILGDALDYETGQPQPGIYDHGTILGDV